MNNMIKIFFFFLVGRSSTSGLRLFQARSEFSLLYKDGEENWRTVGDVPWT